MADANKVRQGLAELREVGDRLMLGDPDARKVRGLVCDLIDTLLGRTANHEDVNVSGARAPALAPNLIRQVIPGQHGGPPQLRPQLAIAAPTGVPAGTPSDAETVAEIERMAVSSGAAPATPTGEPAPALSLADAIALANERRRQQHEKTPPNGGQ